MHLSNGDKIRIIERKRVQHSPTLCGDMRELPCDLESALRICRRKDAQRELQVHNILSPNHSWSKIALIIKQVQGMQTMKRERELDLMFDTRIKARRPALGEDTSRARTRPLIYSARSSDHQSHRHVQIAQVKFIVLPLLTNFILF